MVKRLKKFFSGTYLGLMLVFLYAPILILIVFSFNQSKTLGNWTGFTFDWYVQLFRTPEITDALIVTLTVAAISSIAATVVTQWVVWAYAVLILTGVTAPPTVARATRWYRRPRRRRPERILGPLPPPWLWKEPPLFYPAAVRDLSFPRPQRG